MSPVLIIFLAIGAFALLVVIGLPMAYAFAIVGIGGLVLVVGLSPALFLLGSAPLDWTTLSSFICIPLFILMGQFAFYSGIGADLYDAAHKWMGKYAGGLAAATIAACAAFAACTGSSLASAATMGTIAYPEMKRFGYDDKLAAGSICMGGSLGILIPPSITFIIYGGITETNIGALFIAGILPGFLLATFYIVQIFIRCKIDPKLGPRGPAFSWHQRFRSLTGVWGMLMLFVLVMGGLYFGIVAPSEAGALGAVGSFVIALAKRMLTIDRFLKAAKRTIELTCIIMTLIIGAMIFGMLIAQTGLTQMIAEGVEALDLPPYLIILGIMALLIPLGMALDVAPMILLVVPVVYPIVSLLGFDLIWFGVIVVLLTELAFISPPVGMVVYTAHGVTKVPIQTIFRGVLPFIFSLLLCISLVFAFPKIVLFLPNMMMK